jgi:hypothetical protein
VAERREDLRAADVDRQFVAERLKGALDEGRLDLHEYDERLQTVYAAKTYGDLDQVLADLPGFTPVAQSQLVPSEPAADNRYPTDVARQELAGKPLRSMPKWLIGVWSAWLVAVSVNVVIWLLVSLSSGEFVYFWPMWVAGPWGAVLLATTLTGIMSGDPEKHLERKAEERAERREARRRRRDYR